MIRPYLNNNFLYEKELYSKEFEEVELFRHEEFVLNDYKEWTCSECGEIDCYGECYGEEFGRPKEYSIKDLMDKVPKGVDFSDVKITLASDDWSGRPYQMLILSYMKPIKVDLKKKEKAEKAYNAAKAKYDLECKKYLEWEKQQQITKLESELSKLKCS